MRRRDFIGLVVGAMTVWPARAEQPIVGFLYAGSEPAAPLLAAFHKGLAEIGYVEGRNVGVEYRWANNELKLLPGLAAGLVRRGVAVIATPGSYQAALAAKAITTKVPIVFGTGVDPIEAGLVGSINRPGGNVTGVNYMQAQLATKQLGLLQELLPKARRFAVLVNPDNPVVTSSAVAELQAAVSSIGAQIEILRASDNDEIDAAFAEVSQRHIEGVLVSPGPLFGNRRVQLTTLAARHAAPTMYYDREFAEVGGLISYGSSLAEQYRLTGVYTGRVLRGEKPAEMPVMRAVKFELIVNLATAKTLSLQIPPNLLARADEVIE